MSAYTVRSARPDEAGDILALVNAQPAAHLPPAVLDILLEDGRVFLALMGVTVIGVAATADFEGAATVETLLVRPERRGTGVGDALIHEVERHARWAFNGALLAFPATEAENRFYRSHGFILMDPERIAGPLKRRARGMPVMVKRL